MRAFFLEDERPVAREEGPGARAREREQKRNRDEAPAHPRKIALPDRMTGVVGYSTAIIARGMGMGMGMGRIVTVTVGAATASAEGAGGAGGAVESTVLAGR